ncbi:MAG: hypothetical protein JJT94_07395 [Bernardetiaceae bacterium]|nr:hypothetical protein [Bernardetiaceae bacterium]
MKKVIFVLLSTLLLSCGGNQTTDEPNTANSDKENSTTETPQKHADQDIEKYKELSDSFWKRQIAYSHRINVGCDGTYMPMRKRKLTPEEIKLVNSGTPQGKKLNNEVLIAHLHNGILIELIELEGKYAYVKLSINNAVKEGYILADYCGKSTITALTRKEKLSYTSSKSVSNPEIRPFCKTFIEEKFYKHFTKQIGTNSKPIDIFRQSIDESRSDRSTFSLLLFSVFVGDTETNFYQAGDNGRVSDNIDVFEMVTHEYKAYEFLSTDNFFGADRPSAPFNITDAYVSGDTLIMGDTKLYPTDPYSAFTSHKGSEWFLVSNNRKVKLIDISYITEGIHTNPSQIGHDYFYQLIEIYAQDLLEYPEGYLNNYF